MKTSRIACLLLAGLLLACGSSEADWRKADAQGTVAAFQKFLADHPRDAHAPQARARIEALQDQQAWAQAQQGGTVESFQQYETGQKEGLHLAEARDRIADLQRAAAFKVAQSEATPTAYQDFLQKYPQGPEADQARAQLQKLTAPPPMSTYRVQLGEFHSRKEAQRARARLEKRFAKVLHQVVVIPASAKSRLERVSSVPMSREAAQMACARLKKSHQHCKVVKS